MLKIFLAPTLVSLAALAGVFVWGGVDALLLATALAVLEISLSFDNAVINAKVLAKMSPLWQRRFLVWGMPVAVFGVRFALPVLIVSAAAFISPWGIAVLAFTDPAEYARLLHNADPIIHAFGGSFLLMVALKYFLDEGKQVHWFGALERRLARWGAVQSIELFVACAAVVAVSAASDKPMLALAAGLVGVLLFIVIEGITQSLSSNLRSGAAAGAAGLFVYLNILDAAFSLDGVVGAFALTTQILVILVGLGIGAYFVRAFTVYLTRRNTIQRFIYLEHGAHWAIFFLALCLFAALFVQVPEALPGGMGLLFALLAYLSSRHELKKR